MKVKEIFVVQEGFYYNDNNHKQRGAPMSLKGKHGYSQDFYNWALHNAALLREGKFTQVDIVHVAEEIESMGKSEKRELVSRLAVLLTHLLKWQFQPERHGNSWKYTIQEQRFEITDLLKESPSLKHELAQQLDHAYEKALLLAVKETGLSLSAFPKKCPFSLVKALNADFLPGNQ
jgi:hypothetical protein